MSTNIFTIYDTWYLNLLDYLPILRGSRRMQKLKGGLKFMIRLNTYDLIILNETFIYNIYGMIINKLGLDSIIIDIGAHIGTFSIFAAKKAKNVALYAYEPDSKNYEILNENIVLNNLGSQIRTFKLGVGKRKGIRTLFMSENNFGNHSFYGKSKKRAKIKTISLKDVFEDNKLLKCNLLKLDCEGAEYEIIYNTPKKYLQKVQNIVMEYHPNGSGKEMKEFLESNNFKAHFGSKGLPILFATNLGPD